MQIAIVVNELLPDSRDINVRNREAIVSGEHMSSVFNTSGAS